MMKKWVGTLAEKSREPDFDPVDFAKGDFVTSGKKWRGVLVKK